MKIIHVGAFLHYHYDEVVAKTMEEFGHKVIRFPVYNIIRGPFSKIEKHLSWIGPLSIYMNFQLYRKIKIEKPEIVFIWRMPLVHPLLLRIISIKFQAKLISYNNDDPFSPLYKRGNLYQRLLWRNFKKTIPLYDLNAVFRPQNLTDYKNASSKKTTLFPPFYIPNMINRLAEPVKKYDVIFIGHYEKVRANALNYLIENGIAVKVFGQNWNKKSLSSKYSFEKNIQPITGKAYHEAILSSKICLAFHSRLNRDNYTIRNFEIPALGVLMLSERTKELKEFYQEEKEAVFFSSNEELFQKVTLLLKDENKINSIANAGQLRAFKSGYDVKSRVKNLLLDISDLFED